jgi:uncharacterized protein YccT (UPF0319 family)
MKKAYLINMSEDGNCQYVFTNIKAMYEYIHNSNLYSVDVIEVFHASTMSYTLHKLNYNNLNSLLKKNKAYSIKLKKAADSYGTLSIEELCIKSK